MHLLQRINIFPLFILVSAVHIERLRTQSDINEELTSGRLFVLSSS